MHNWQTFLLAIGVLYQTIASWQEDRQPPLGTRVDVGGYYLHLHVVGERRDATTVTIVYDGSLGGLDGYLLVDRLAELTQVCIYDRAGYGDSDFSLKPRDSQQIVRELDALMIAANIQPPYILIGDSFGSYNVRLYAQEHPEKAVGLVLVDGLHETRMLDLPISTKILKSVFISGFIMSTFGAAVGIIRILANIKVFELIKPQLSNFPAASLAPIKRSFYRPQHWLTMCRELWNLDRSGRQVSIARDFGNLPIVSIKASSFFHPTWWTVFVPLKTVNKTRDLIHLDLAKLSNNFYEIPADQSSHFVWTDRPDCIVDAVKTLLDQLENEKP